jgi:hypothetical protein
MVVQYWAVTGPKALAPRASGLSHILGLKGRVGSVLGSSPTRETVWGRPTVLARCGARHAVVVRSAARAAAVNQRSELRVVFASVGRGSRGHAEQGFGVENLPRRAVHGEAVEAAVADDVLVRGIRWSATMPRWSYSTMETIGV